MAVHLGTDRGALVMTMYGHWSEELARERLKRAYAESVRNVRPAYIHQGYESR